MTTVRVYGNELDVTDFYVDATVSIDVDGTVTLTEDASSNPRTWEMPFESFEALQNEDYIAEHSAIDPDHRVWTVLQDLYEIRTDSTINDIATTLDTSAEDLYRTVVFAMQ